MKKNNTAEKTALDAEKLAAALKEGTEQTLRGIMNEAVSNIMKEAEEDESDVEDDSYDEEDVDTENVPVDSDETPAEGGEEGDSEMDSEDADEWSDMEQYKVGDDDYDFTGVEGDDFLKVYNRLGDDDQIFVQKQDDGTYEVKDDETGAEFVIELNPDAENGDEDFGEDSEDAEIELDFGDEAEGEDEGDEELELDLGGNDEGDDELEIDIDGEDDSDALNEENLGYTDNYQKDVFGKKFNMNEPADSKTTNDWDGGVPKGNSKPWAGKGNSKPFEKKVNECGEPVQPNMDANLEENDTVSSEDSRHMKMGKWKQHRPNAPAYDVRKEDNPKNGLEESIKRIISKAKAIQEQNEQYAKCIDNLKKSIFEIATLNVNEGKIIDLLVNESMTKDEKKRLCERFNAVKTIAEGKALYNTIKGELNEGKKSAPVVEKQFIAESTNKLNEATLYANDPSLDLMTRMDNLFKK